MDIIVDKLPKISKSDMFEIKQNCLNHQSKFEKSCPDYGLSYFSHTSFRNAVYFLTVLYPSIFVKSVVFETTVKIMEYKFDIVKNNGILSMTDNKIMNIISDAWHNTDVSSKYDCYNEFANTSLIMEIFITDIMNDVLDNKKFRDIDEIYLHMSKIVDDVMRTFDNDE